MSYLIVKACGQEQGQRTLLTHIQNGGISISQFNDHVKQIKMKDMKVEIIFYSQMK